MPRSSAARSSLTAKARQLVEEAAEKAARRAANKRKRESAASAAGSPASSAYNSAADKGSSSGSLASSSDDGGSIASSRSSATTRRLGVLQSLTAQQKVAAGENPWPTAQEFAATQSGAAPVPLSTTDFSALLSHTETVVRAHPSSFVYAGLSICDAREVTSGCIFIVAPPDTAQDRHIHEWYQIVAMPEDQAEVRCAVKVMSSLGDTAVTLNKLAAAQMTRVEFAPMDKLCVLPGAEAVNDVMLMRTLVSWAPLSYWDPVGSPPNVTLPPPPAPGVKEDPRRTSSSSGPAGQDRSAQDSSRTREIRTSIPPVGSVKDSYRHREFMYSVPPAVVAASLAREKKEAGEKGASSVLSELIKVHDGTAAAPHTLKKLGMSKYILQVLSVAKSEALQATLSVVGRRFQARVYCPVDLVSLRSFVGSWMIPDDGRDVKFFMNLMDFYGSTLHTLHARPFECLEEVEEHSQVYLRLVARIDFAKFNTNLRVLHDACRNVLTAIFMLYNMRFCFQEAMLAAVSRLFEYLRLHDFGPASEYSSRFITICIRELFRSFESVRAAMMDSRGVGDEAAEFLEELSGLPDLAAGSPICLVHADFTLRDRSGAAALLVQGMGDHIGAARAQDDAVDRRPKKPKRPINKALADQAAARANAPTGKPKKMPINGPTATPPGKGNDASRAPLCCSRFCSVAGCASGPKCKYQHAIPVSEAWQKMRAYFDEKKIEASVDFAAGGP